MQAGSVRGYLDLAGHQAKAVPQRLGYDQTPCLVYGRAHTIKIPCVWAGAAGDRISTTEAAARLPLRESLADRRAVHLGRQGLRHRVYANCGQPAPGRPAESPPQMSSE